MRWKSVRGEKCRGLNRESGLPDQVIVELLFGTVWFV